MYEKNSLKQKKVWPKEDLVGHCPNKKVPLAVPLLVNEVTIKRSLLAHGCYFLFPKNSVR